MDVDKFIQLVQGQPAIWDKNSTIYNDRTEKDTSWLVVVKGMFEARWKSMSHKEKQKSISDCKSKWKNLRDTYIKYSNLVTKKRKKYIYADAMSFLLSSIKISKLQEENEKTAVETPEDTHPVNNRQSTQSCDQLNQKCEEKAGIHVETTEDTHFLDNQQSADNSSPVLPSKKSKASKEAKLTQFQTELLKILERCPASEEEDPDKTFLLSILPKMQNLNDNDKLQFQMHVLKFFVDLNKNSTQSQFHHSSQPYRAYPYQFAQNRDPLTLTSPTPSTDHSDESVDIKPFL